MDKENPANRQIDLLGLIADDRSLIPGERIVRYRPHWTKLTGSMTASIFLSRLVDCWVESGRRPFYKFAQPCAHPLHKPGESWTEELGLGRREFENARGRIAVRTRGENESAAFASYYVDASRLTWYVVNENRLAEGLSQLGPQPEWRDPLPYEYRPPLRNLVIRIQFNAQRRNHYRALVERDGEYCQHCGATHDLTVDHILAIVNGGSNAPNNLQLLCRSCNSRKGAR